MIAYGYQNRVAVMYLTREENRAVSGRDRYTQDELRKALQFYGLSTSENIYTKMFPLTAEEGNNDSDLLDLKVAYDDCSDYVAKMVIGKKGEVSRFLCGGRTDADMEERISYQARFAVPSYIQEDTIPSDYDEIYEEPEMPDPLKAAIQALENITSVGFSFMDHNDLLFYLKRFEFRDCMIYTDKKVFYIIYDLPNMPAERKYRLVSNIGYFIGECNGRPVASATTSYIKEHCTCIGMGKEWAEI
jgi:hypothetical protein